jgi:hypothetical protein
VVLCAKKLLKLHATYNTSSIEKSKKIFDETFILGNKKTQPKQIPLKKGKSSLRKIDELVKSPKSPPP